MPKYLQKVSYTAEGAQGLLADGGTSRRQVAEALAGSVGARIEGFYFALGETDLYVIVEAPDDTTVAAVSLVLGASGAVETETVKLLEPEDLDKAAQQAPSYTPPGR